QDRLRLSPRDCCGHQQPVLYRGAGCPGQPHHSLRRRLPVGHGERADLRIPGGAARGARAHPRGDLAAGRYAGPRGHAGPSLAEPGALPAQAAPTAQRQLGRTAMSTEYEIRFAIDPAAAAMMDTSDLRANFLIDDLFAGGQVRWCYSHYDRMAVGGAVPEGGDLVLEAIKPTGTGFFLERRELIAVNIGEAGTITVDGAVHAVGPRDMLYVGMGARDVRFGGAGAKFYLLK